MAEVCIGLSVAAVIAVAVEQDLLAAVCFIFAVGAVLFRIA